MKAIKRRIPLPIKHKIKSLIYQLLPGTNRPPTLQADVYVISYPKCGRTWLRMMLGKVISTHLGMEEATALQLGDLISHPAIPTLKFTHDDQANLKTSAELNLTKNEYKHKKVIFLVRDVRDVVVSYYFELTKRHTVNPHYTPYEGDLSSFLRYERGSLDTIIHYYNIWAENRNLPQGFLLVRYEDLHAAPQAELRRVLDFIGLPQVADQVIADAVAYASFDNMRKLEASQALDTFRLRPGNENDPESFKTRRGKVKGFVDYLTADDIAYIDERVASELAPFFGYS